MGEFGSGDVYWSTPLMPLWLAVHYVTLFYLDTFCCTVLFLIVFCIVLNCLVLHCSLLYSLPSPLFSVSNDRLVLESLYLEDGSVTISTVFLTFWLSCWWMNSHLCNIRLFIASSLVKHSRLCFFYVSEDTRQ